MARKAPESTALGWSILEERQIVSAMHALYSAQERADLDARYAEWKESAVSDPMLAYAKGKTAVKGAMRNHQNPL